MPKAAPVPTTSTLTASVTVSLGPLQRKIRRIPHRPGVYRWLDIKGNILYVGKAKDLRKRVSSYVMPSATRNGGYRKRGLFERMADIEITCTGDETEALVLEAHLIRKHKPLFNIKLTRETHYVFIRVGVHEPFPSIRLVHVRERDGAEYIGPFTDVYMQHRILDILRRLYGFRTCAMGIQPTLQPELFHPGLPALPLDVVIRGRKDRRIPCLDYHIDRCIAPCMGGMRTDEYASRAVDAVRAFYGGETAPVIARLTQELRDCGGAQKYTLVKETIDLFRYLHEKKRKIQYTSPDAGDADAIATTRWRGSMYVSILQVRNGQMINDLFVSVGSVLDPSEALEQFVFRFYEDTKDVPRSILLPRPLEQRSALQQILAQRSGSRVRIFVPRKPEAKRLLALAAQNAQEKAMLAHVS